MNHFFNWNGKRRTAASGLPESVKTFPAGVQCGRLPDFRISFGRLELTRAEQARTPLFRRCAGNVSHAFKTNGSFRAEHLKTESRTGGGYRAKISGHALFHPEQYRSRVVAIDFNDPSETLAIDVIDRTAQIDHAVYCVNA